MASVHPIHSPHTPHIGYGITQFPQVVDYNRAVIFSKNSIEYFGFTTISRNGFHLEATFWLTLEHYIQAKKFVGHASRIDAIKNFENPEDISSYVNEPDNARLLDDNWSKKKCEYMYHGLYAKFIQNEGLVNKLLDTEDKFLIYQTVNDWTWGTGSDREGKNYLGRLLCNLRTYLRINPTSRAPPIYKYSDLPDNNLVPLSTLRTSTSTSFDGVLYFGDRTKAYFEFCNDSNHDIELDGVLWLTVTHYYLAQKFHGNVHLQNTIAAFESPSQARQFAYNKTAFQAPDFQRKQDSIMQHALEAKFARHPTIAEALASTHPKKLIYECAEDPYWGIGHDAKGLNRLGTMLTDLRKNIPPTPLPSRHCDDLCFTSTAIDYFEFTPYSQHSIRLDGELWPTVSHYFQAQKFIDRPDIAKLIQASDTPLAAWEIAHKSEHAILVPMNFLNERDDVMKKAMRAKVVQHEEVYRLLKGTGTRRLIFSAEDTHWGIGHDHIGKNMIGEILMEIRSTLSTMPHKTPETYEPYSKHSPPVMPLPREVSTSTNAIRFFNQKDHLYPLTTFSMFQFRIGDYVYRTLNHYFQAQKFTTSPDVHQSVINAPTASEALKISQENAEEAIDDFNTDRVKVMKTGLRARFEQNPSLKDLLMETANRELIFNNKRDSFWGIGDGSGNNRFGKLLMKIREQYSIKVIELLTSTSRSHSYGAEHIDFSRSKPTPRYSHAPKHIFLDTGCEEPPTSFSADRDSGVILAKDARGETIASLCDPNIRYPSSLCYDKEHLYVITAPTLVKINKTTGKKVNQIPLPIAQAEVNYTRDSVRVVYYQRSPTETVYSTDLLKY